MEHIALHVDSLARCRYIAPSLTVYAERSAMSTTRDRLKQTRRPLPTREDLKNMPRLDQFELVNTHALNRFHFNQLDWAVTNAGLQLKPLQADSGGGEGITNIATLPKDEKVHAFRSATYARIAVEDPRVFSNGSRPADSYNEVELEISDHGVKCTCSCEWSREGREYGGRFYPYRACSHIMAAVAGYDPDVMKAYKQYKAQQQAQLEKLAAVEDQEGLSLTDM